jgi:hypothetical protein
MIFNPEFWRQVYGYFDFEDVYRGIVQHCQDGDWIVEVGSFIGKSTCCLGHIIQASKKKINVLCVDPANHVGDG